MRISPVGYAYNDLDTVLQKAAEFTEITHNHPEGIKGGQATAAAIYLAENGQVQSPKSRIIIENELSIRFEPTRRRDSPIL